MPRSLITRPSTRIPDIARALLIVLGGLRRTGPRSPARGRGTFDRRLAGGPRRGPHNVGGAGHRLPRPHPSSRPRRAVVARDPRAQSRCPRRRASPRPRTQGRPRARAAARHPARHQGQRRDEGPHRDDRRIARARWQRHRPRCAARRAVAHGRRDRARQEQPVRMGQLPLGPFDQRLVRGRRPDPQPVRARPLGLRIERRHRHGGRREPRWRRASAAKPMDPSLARRRSPRWSA